MTTTIRIDDELKKECDLIFADIGLTMSAAMTLFLKQVVKTKGIPFELKAHMPNKETRKTLDAIIRGTEPLSAPFDTVDKLMEELTRA
jgi:addiction module antitoxin, RelB/DinJ family